VTLPVKRRGHNLVVLYKQNRKRWCPIHDEEAILPKRSGSANEVRVKYNKYQEQDRQNSRLANNPLEPIKSHNRRRRISRFAIPGVLDLLAVGLLSIKDQWEEEDEECVQCNHAADEDARNYGFPTKPEQQWEGQPKRSHAEEHIETMSHGTRDRLIRSPSFPLLERRAKQIDRACQLPEDRCKSKKSYTDDEDRLYVKRDQDCRVTKEVCSSGLVRKRDSVGSCRPAATTTAYGTRPVSSSAGFPFSACRSISGNLPAGKGAFLEILGSRYPD
jgi:hypothetical protein